jgi:hypothetical protein
MRRDMSECGVVEWGRTDVEDALASECEKCNNT